VKSTAVIRAISDWIGEMNLLGDPPHETDWGQELCYFIYGKDWRESKRFQDDDHDLTEKIDRDYNFILDAMPELRKKKEAEGDA